MQFENMFIQAYRMISRKWNGYVSIQSLEPYIFLSLLRMIRRKWNGAILTLNFGYEGPLFVSIYVGMVSDNIPNFLSVILWSYVTFLTFDCLI